MLPEELDIDWNEIGKAIGSGVPAAIALVGIYISAKIAFSNQQTLANRSAREEAYALLTASEYELGQTLVNYLDTNAAFRYHERKWMLAGEPSDSLEFQETRRLVVRSENTIQENVRVWSALAKAAAKARIVFPRSNELEALFAAVIDEHVGPAQRPMTPELAGQALETWWQGNSAWSANLVHERYSKRIRQLLVALRARMNDPLP